ncbi:hypothetical protein AVEN_43236-1 [Araneus ventricosus]|uniref:Uncharacterized protein n=1 Tax=Araneus ventricosus TaxID=182803 RepID=A0A4Y2X5J4_ARAVE|nr:hypothetical protein AVEN_43236-1 [Araneus ventricosus]
MRGKTFCASRLWTSPGKARLDLEGMRLFRTIHPANYDTNEIIQDFERLNLQPALISPMRHRSVGNFYPLYLVVRNLLAPKSRRNIAEIYHIESIGDLRVKSEPYRCKDTPGQCFKCQDFLA